MHPRLPWLTLACTNPAHIERGAIIVVDVQAGSLVSVTETTDGGAGWYGDGPLVLWNATGDRLCSNVATSGIGLFERATLAARNFPDDAADSPVDYAWVDHRIFTNRGNFFDPKNDERMGRFDFEVVSDINWTIDVFKWNAELGAVVGAAFPAEGTDADKVELVAYAPQRDQLIYRKPLAQNAPGQRGYLRMAWSPSRRWLAASAGSSGSVLDVYDTMNGGRVRRVTLGRANERSVIVGDDGALIGYSSNAHPVGDDQGALVEKLAPTGARMQLSTERPWAETSELAPIMAMSPDESALAVFLADSTLAVFDLKSGEHRRTFPVAIPGEASAAKQNLPRVGVLWISPTHVALVGAHFVDVWSVEGTRVAEFAMPR